MGEQGLLRSKGGHRRGTFSQVKTIHLTLAVCLLKFALPYQIVWTSVLKFQHVIFIWFHFFHLLYGNSNTFCLPLVIVVWVGVWWRPFREETHSPPYIFSTPLFIISQNWRLPRWSVPGGWVSEVWLWSSLLDDPIYVWSNLCEFIFWARENQRDKNRWVVAEAWGSF